MDRISRKLQNIKQTSIEVKSNQPSVGEITKPEIRYIPGRGLYLVVKYNNKLYYDKLESDIDNA